MHKSFAKSGLLSVLALAMAACLLFGILGLMPGASAEEGTQRLGPEILIEEDFENASVSAGEDGFSVLSEHVSGGPGNSYEIVTDNAGNKSLKMMYREDPEDRAYSNDERALVVRAENMVPYQNYLVSFYAKRASNIWISMELRSGMPSKNYGECRTMSTAGNEAFSELRADKGVLVYQIIPADPSGLFEFTINPRKVVNTDTGLGLIIDDIRVRPYTQTPDGRENMLENGKMTGYWHEESATWDFNDGDESTDDWIMTVGTGVDGWWQANRLSDTDNAYIATNNGLPVSISQHVTLEPNTEYDFSLFVRRFFMGTIWKAADTLSVYITDGSGYESRVTFYTKDMGQEAFEQYVKIGGVLKTGAATEYTFYIQHDVPPEGMSWRGFQVDEVALYKADNAETLDYADAQTTNVTETDDIYSGIEGDTVLQTDLSQGAARIVYELDVTQNAYYTAAVAAQKVARPVTSDVADGSATNNCVKPMNIRVSVETAADGSGEVLAAMTDDRYVHKAAETFRVHFNSGANDKVYLIVTADAITGDDIFVANNTLLNFKDFSLTAHSVTAIEAEAQTVVVGDTGTVEVFALLDDGRRVAVGDSVTFTPDNGNVTFEGNAFTAKGVGSSTVTAAWGGHTCEIAFTVLDVIEGIEAGEDREIRLGESAALTVTASYATIEDEDVTAQSAVAVEDPAIVRYENGVLYAEKVGSTAVTVTFRGQTDTFTVTVPKELTRIETSADRTIALNGTYTVQVTGYYNDGTSAAIAAEDFTVESSAANVTVNGAVLTASAVGDAQITVRVGELSAAFRVTVTNALTSIDAGSDREIELGQTGQLTVTATYEDQSMADMTADSEVEIENPEILSFADGTFTALKVGQTQVTVTYSGQSDTFTVTVPRRLTGIDAGGDRTLDLNVASPLTVTAYYNDGTSETAPVGDVSVTIEDETIVKYENGAFTGLAIGETEATVSFGGEEETIALRVPKKLVSMSILGEDGTALTEFTLEKGESLDVTVQGVYNDGSKQAINAVLASDSQSAVVSGWTITADKAGTAHITANYPGTDVQGTLTVNVPRRLESLSVDGDAGLYVGGTGELVVRAVYNDGTQTVVTEGAEITSSDASVVTADGLTLRAEGVGSAVVTVRYEGKEATFAVTVTNPIVSFSVICPELTAGGSVSLTVTATLADGSTQTITDAIVTSANEAVVTADGLTVTGVAAGETQLVVRVGNLAQTVTVTVLEASGCGGTIGTAAFLAGGLVVLCAAGLAIGKKARKGGNR